MSKHAILRAKQRYNIKLDNIDIFIIKFLIFTGFAKEIRRPKNKYGKENESKLYNLRYKNKLISPIIENNQIVTFIPNSKGSSFKKYMENKKRGYYE